MIITETRPWLSTLAFVGFFINKAIADGHRDAISFEQVYASLGNGTILEDLNRWLPGQFDFGLFPAGGDQSNGLNDVLDGFAVAFRGRERRKLGIESSGLHLLMALILEAMQQGYWVDPER